MLIFNYETRFEVVEVIFLCIGDSQGILSKKAQKYVISRHIYTYTYFYIFSYQTCQVSADELCS